MEKVATKNQLANYLRMRRLHLIQTREAITNNENIWYHGEKLARLEGQIKEVENTLSYIEKILL